MIYINILILVYILAFALQAIIIYKQENKNEFNRKNKKYFK